MGMRTRRRSLAAGDARPSAPCARIRQMGYEAAQWRSAATSRGDRALNITMTEDDGNCLYDRAARGIGRTDTRFSLCLRSRHATPTRAFLISAAIDQAAKWLAAGGIYAI